MKAMSAGFTNGRSATAIDVSPRFRSPAANSTVIAEVLSKGKQTARQLYPVIVAAQIVAVVYIAFSGRGIHAFAYAMIAFGALFNLRSWLLTTAAGIPLAATLAMQDLIWYGIPFITNHKCLALESDNDILKAAACVLMFDLSLAAGRSLGLNATKPTGGRVMVLDLENVQASNRLVKLVLFVVFVCMLLEWSFVSGRIYQFLAFIPFSSINIVRTALSAGESGAFLLLGFLLGRGTLSKTHQFAFIAIYLLVFTARVTSILLSSCVALIMAVMLGLYLGSGKIPYRVLLASAVVLGFLNFGKFEMRARYWQTGFESVSVSQLPNYFGNWIGYSVDKITNRVDDKVSSNADDLGQSPLERFTNIEMVTYAFHAVDDLGYPTLNGYTYAVCWQAIVPRLFWPNKPRSHIGQEILNVHFDRQTQKDTFTTYISWGIIPESIGNFGSLFGPLVSGLVLGAILGWMEKKTINLSLFSLPVILVCFLWISLSIAILQAMSVWLSSMFQVWTLLICVLYPFMRRVPVRQIISAR